MPLNSDEKLQEGEFARPLSRTNKTEIKADESCVQGADASTQPRRRGRKRKSEKQAIEQVTKKQERNVPSELPETDNSTNNT